jgi:hypothetical protein
LLRRQHARTIITSRYDLIITDLRHTNSKNLFYDFQEKEARTKNKPKSSEGDNEEVDMEEMALSARPLLMGAVAGAIEDIKPAKEIVDEMVQGAIQALRLNSSKISKL